jgi:hypothetical protein
MPSSIQPKNLSDQLIHEARGNPPGAHPKSAVGNFFPGLEFNFLNVWKRIFVGIEVLESSGEVINVDPNAPADVQNLKGKFLAFANATVAGGQITDFGTQVYAIARGPIRNDDGSKGQVRGLTIVYLEWGNLLAEIHETFGGKNQPIFCLFVDDIYDFVNDRQISKLTIVQLPVRRLLDDDSAVISKDANEPGELTESLCSPWQTDFIGCACYYWAANRPDYINLWPVP